MTQTAIDSIQEALQAFSKIALEADIKSKNLENMFRYCLAWTAKEVLHENSISNINQSTGIPRATISSFLDGEAPTVKTDYLARLFNDLRHHCDENGILPLKGENSFFELAYKRLGSTYSPELAYNKMATLGVIEMHKEGVKLLSDFLYVKNDNEQALIILSKAIHRLVKTILTNHKNTNSSERLFQRTYYTAKVPPQKLKEVRELVREKMEGCFAELEELIDSFELDIDSHDFLEYGFSMFEFSDLHYDKIKKV